MIMLLYGIMISYYYFFDMPYDLHAFVTTSMTIILIGLNGALDSLSNEIKDIGKFIGHLLFISLVTHLVGCMMYSVYSTIFYLGFMNTVIYTSVFTFLGMGVMIKIVSECLENNLSKSNIGQQMITIINNYYNIYIASKNWSNIIVTNFLNIYYNYIKSYGSIIYRKLSNVNADLSDNTGTKIVMNKIDAKYADAKQCLLQNCFSPYFFNLFNTTMNNDPFRSGDALAFNNIYKNPGLNTDMSFLQTSHMDIFEDNLDDFDDYIDDLQNEEKIVVDQESILEMKTPELKNSLSQSSIDVIPDTNTQTNNRNALRKKIAAKKAERSIRGGKNQQNPMTNPMMNPMQMPGMDKMMETMLQGDNLKKLMEQFPPDKIGMSNMDPEQMRQIMQSMMKNKK